MKTYKFAFFTLILSFLLSEYSYSQELDTNSLNSSEIENITIRSTRIPAGAKDIGSSLYIISEDQIKARGFKDAIDAISSAPGVTSKQNGSFGGVGTIRIRGASSSQTLVLVDGVPVNDSSSPAGGYNFEYLNTSNIQSIEVLKGSQSTLWGSDAIGGVINIYTKQPESTSFGASAEIGSFGLKRGSADINFAGSNSRFRVSTSKTSVDGISKADEKDGNSEDDGFESESYSMSGSIDLDSLILKGSLSYMESQVEYDSYGFATGVQDGDERSNTDEFIGSISAFFDLFDDKLQNSIFISQSDINRDYYSNGSFSFGAEGKRELIRYQGNIEVNEFNKIAFGLESEESKVDVDESTIDGSFLLYEFRPNSKIIISTGIRNDDHEGFGSKTTRRISGTFKPSDNLIIRSSWGEGFKVPTIFQSTYFCCGATSANSSIRPETSTSYDFGFELFFNEMNSNFSITYFDQDINDQINFSFGVGGYENIDKVNSEGFEIALDYQISKLMSLYLNYSYIDSVDGNGSSLFYVAKDSGEAGLIYEPNNSFSGSIIARYNGSESSSYGKIDSWIRFDVNGSYKLSGTNELYFRIENLLDEEYQQIFGYGTPERSGFIGLRSKF
ncbi:MAG: TonB-dependent receptor plug domain-containing protein [Alphaproteobacteria bacterium]